MPPPRPGSVTVDEVASRQHARTLPGWHSALPGWRTDWKSVEDANGDPTAREVVEAERERATSAIPEANGGHGAFAAPGGIPPPLPSTRTAAREVSPAPDAAPRPVALATAAPPANKRDPHSSLFRAEALAAYRRGDRAASVVRITSVSRWGVLLALGCTLLIGASLTIFGRIEETSPARGVLRAAFGVQPVTTPIGGTVREVGVQAGAHVSQGQVIARLDSTPLAASLQQAEQLYNTSAAQWRSTRAVLERNHRRSVALLEARMALLERSRRQKEQLVTLRQRRSDRIGAPELRGVVEDSVREDSVEGALRARDDLLRVLDEQSALKMQLAAAVSDYDQRIANGEERVNEARARRDEAHTLLQQTELRAPIAGTLESLRAYPGQVVQPAEWIARVVSEQAPRTIAAFVPERDAAFLAVGATAHVEVDQLPLGEFGSLRARVTRVGGELAEASELAASLGEAAPSGPHVRVELALANTDVLANAPALRPGTLVTARIALRQRRLLAIVFEPARRWLQ
ncbi:MAG TPA: HlyD family efflux transporter periplasmic adaptor subunit [Polyangiales bacterium]